MDAGQWHAPGPAPAQLPPPPSAPPTFLLPPPPSHPPYGYLIPQQAPPPGWVPVPPAGYWQSPPAAVPARRTHWLGWGAAALSILVVAVPALLSSPRRGIGGVGGNAGLHAVAGVSQLPWSAEFVDSTGLPARWDPCTPITYVVNYANAPAGAAADVRQAMVRLATASGLTFVAGADSTEAPMRNRSAYQPTVYGKTWAPLLLAWSAPTATDLLGDPKSEAVTVPVAVASAGGIGGGSLVSAEIVLNTDRALPTGFGPGPSEGEVLMHELGHAVGLGHVASISEAMYPSVRGLAAYGAGDLEGFAAVGLSAGCHPAPAAHPLTVQPSSLG